VVDAISVDCEGDRDTRLCVMRKRSDGNGGRGWQHVDWVTEVMRWY
jgi:hypothetical protein